MEGDGGSAWIRHRPDRRERRLAAAMAMAAGLAVGAATLWLARLMLARERISRRPPDAREAAPGRTGTEAP